MLKASATYDKESIVLILPIDTEEKKKIIGKILEILLESKLYPEMFESIEDAKGEKNAVS